MPDIINVSKQKNYVCGRKIFLLDVLNYETCAELIGNISNMVDNLRWTEPYNIQIEQINNPYKLPKTPQIIDLYINSRGGTVNVMTSIMSLLTIARAKNTIIRTTVMGDACSCASMIAIQGTPGFRIMYANAYQLVHYGSSHYDVNKVNEIDTAAIYEKDIRSMCDTIYLNNSNLTKKDLSKYQKTEYNYIPAMKCLERNMCDWILNTNGTFISQKHH